MPATVFDKPIFPGAKIVLATLTVENTSGAYSETVTDDRISASMKAYALEIDDPSIFGDKISVTAGAGEYTIECDDVAGSTTVKISFLKVLDDPTAVTSTEFDILENRIGDLDDLTTTAKTNLVNSVNEVNAHLVTFYTATRSSISQGTGNDYWSIEIPPKTGYERKIVSVNPSSDNILYMRTSFSGNNAEVHLRNVGSSSITFDLEVICAYVPN